MKNFRGTKNLNNILGGLKSNVGIFREIIYLFNPFLNQVFDGHNCTKVREKPILTGCYHISCIVLDS